MIKCNLTVPLSGQARILWMRRRMERAVRTVDESGLMKRKRVEHQVMLTLHPPLHTHHVKTVVIGLLDNFQSSTSRTQ